MSIVLKNITKSYGSKNGYSTIALDNINLELNDNEMTAIMGKSGCGKSTLLNIIGGLTMPTNGELYINDKKMTLSMQAMSIVRRKHIGIIVQNFALINNRTGLDNILLAYQKNKGEKHIISKIKKIAKQFGVEDKLDCFPFEMSGGECQRIAILRAIINEPDIILADEPTGSLDTINSKIVLDLLKGLKNNNKTVVVVTHDPKVAEQCDKVIQMNDGKIVS